MKVTKIENGSTLILKIEGRLDTVTSPEVYAIVQSELGGVIELKFDMAELSYISSAGLRVLLSAQKIMKKQGKMSIINADESVKEVFAVTGFDEFLTIE